MKLAVSIYTNKALEMCINLIDTAVLCVSKYSYIYSNDFNLDEALELCCLNKVEPIIAINKVFTQNEIKEISLFIQQYKSHKFIVSDLGVVEIIKSICGLENVIYDPDTLICNSMDLSLYNKYGFDGLAVSNEITIKDLIAMHTKTNAPIFYQVFGRKMMFYSRRKILSLYEKHYNLNIKREKLSLVEEMRSYHIPFEENDNGLFCFRPYYISLLNEIHNINFIKYAFIESYDLNNDLLIKVVETYKGVIDKSIKINEGEDIIKSLQINTEDGFAYEDTAYVKEKVYQ